MCEGDTLAACLPVDGRRVRGAGGPRGGGRGAGRRTAARAPGAVTSTGVAHDAAKADVGRRCVDGLALPGGGAVAQAVVGRAEVRAALDHAAGDRLVDLG